MNAPSLPIRLVYLILVMGLTFASIGNTHAQTPPQTLKSRLISPANGSTLPNFTLNLEWTKGVGVSGYALWVGTAVDGYDIHASNPTVGTTSKSIAIPVANAGGKIYVRLFSNINGAWLDNYYIFWAPPVEKAVFESPTPENGATLTGSTLTCNWSPGMGVSQYAMWVGSAYSTYDLGAFYIDSATHSQTVTLPTDGGPVYVALWSLINGAYQGSHYWFNTASPTGGTRQARVTSPVSASTLTSSTLSLTWDAGVGASSYALWVGTQAGGYDIYAGYEGTNLAKTITVPTDGTRIFVTLHSMIGGGYQSNGYWFTAFNRPPPLPAKVTSPAKGATLSGTTLPLEWGAGIGAVSYGFWFGTAPWTYDLLAQNTGTVRSWTAPGVPQDGRPVYVKLFTNFLSPAPQLSTTTWFWAPNTATGSKPALMLTPLNDTVLSADGFTFQRDTGSGITSAALWIGSTAGNYDLWSGTMGATQSYKPPLDGRQLYVRLHSMIGGVWKPVDYIYTAPSPGKAEITSPATGTLLPSSNTTFQWNTGNGVANYALWVGRKPGGSDLYAEYEGLNHSKTLTLPQDGSPLYVTLHSLLNGAYQGSETFYDTLAHTSNTAPLQITTAALPSGTRGWSYPATSLSTEGGFGEARWNLLSGSLPPGLVLGQNGSISGVPTTVGTNEFTVHVADESGYEASKALSVNVNYPPIVINGVSDGVLALPAGKQGIAYGTTISASGGTGVGYTWAVAPGVVPAGLAFSAAGTLYGTPAQAGTYTFTVQVSDNESHTATVSATLAVGSPGTVTGGGTGSGGVGGGNTGNITIPSPPPARTLALGGRVMLRMKWRQTKYDEQHPSDRPNPQTLTSESPFKEEGLQSLNEYLSHDAINTQAIEEGEPENEHTYNAPHYPTAFDTGWTDKDGDGIKDDRLILSLQVRIEWREEYDAGSGIIRDREAPAPDDIVMRFDQEETDFDKWIFGYDNGLDVNTTKNRSYTMDQMLIARGISASQWVNVEAPEGRSRQFKLENAGATGRFTTNTSQPEKYARISLDGRPMSDRLPDEEQESDHGGGGAYVSAATGLLHYSPVDARVNLGATELALSVSRQATSHVWSRRFGERPHEDLSLAYGAGWQSSLCPHIKMEMIAGVEGMRVTAYDEEGESYVFIWRETAYNQQFFVPSRAHPQTAKHSQAKLERNVIEGKNYWVLTKKFGTTCYYLDDANDSPVPLTSPSWDRYRHSASEFMNDCVLRRLKKVSDSMGNSLEYDYPSKHTLIPWRIRDPKRDNVALYIYENTAGLISRIVKPDGNEVSYIYEKGNGLLSQLSGEAVKEPVWLLTEVESNGEKEKYQYEVVREIDPSPTLVEPFTPRYHVNLVSVEDALGRKTSFEYSFEYSDGQYQHNYIERYPDNSTSTRIQGGRPRIIRKVHLSDGHLTTFDYRGNLTFSNNREQPLTAGGGYTVDVSSACGAYRYDFLNPEGYFDLDDPTYYFDVSPWWSWHNLWNHDATTGYIVYPPAYSYPQRHWDPWAAFDLSLCNSATVYFTKMTLTSDVGAESYVESYDFNFDAGMALEKFVDINGNTTEYRYNDASPVAQEPGFVELWYGFGSNPFFNQKRSRPEKTYYYDDPTEIITQGLINHRILTYEPTTRMLWGVQDEKGRVTSYTIDTEKRLRLSMTLTPANAAEGGGFSESYHYENVTFPGFMTKKTVSEDGVSLVAVYEPDVLGRVLLTTVDPGGLNLKTTVERDFFGKKRFVTDPRGNTVEYGYDATTQRLERIVNPDATTRRFTYDAVGNVITETDEESHFVTHWYDSRNRRIRTDGPLPGQTTSMTYDPHSLPDLATDARGVITDCDYDSIGRLIAMKKEGQSTFYSYSGQNCGATVREAAGFKPGMIIFPDGGTVVNSYDRLFRQIGKSISDGGHWTYGYDDAGNQILAIDPLLHVTQTTYDAQNRATEVSHPGGFTFTSYLIGGRVKTQQDEKVRTTTYQYDKAGRLKTTFFPAVAGLGVATETRGYDENGNVISVTDALGHTTVTDYDVMNRPAQVIYPAVAVGDGTTLAHPTTQTVYDRVGNPTHEFDTLGNETIKTYDAARRLLSTRSPAIPVNGGAAVTTVVAYAYDYNGNVTSTTDANGHVTLNTYDAHNRLTSTTDAESRTTRFGYDNGNNRVVVIDGNGQATRFTYDHQHRVTREAQVDGGDLSTELGVWTVTHYDAMNKTRRVDLMAGAEATGSATDYRYDQQNRLVGVVYHQDPTQPANPLAPLSRIYSYDEVDNLLSVTEPGKPEANVVYTYDERNRVLTEVSQGVTHSYGYDLVGHRVSTTHGGTGTVLLYDYDDMGRLTRILEGARETRFMYDLAGRMVGKRQPNQSYVSQNWDAQGRLLSAMGYASQGMGGAADFVFLWQHDAAGSVTRRDEVWTGVPARGAGSRATLMTYDAADHLTGETEYEGAEAKRSTAYSYDAAGNRTARAVASTRAGVETGSWSYSYNGLNQLTSVTRQSGSSGPASVTYTYDYNGNRRTRTASGQGTDTYDWDEENRLIAVAKAGGGTHRYGYDYRTRRISREEPQSGAGAQPVRTAVTYSGGLAVAEYGFSASQPATRNAQPTVENIRTDGMGGGVGGMGYSIRTAGTGNNSPPLYRFTVSDARGDVVAQTDENGAYTWTASYEGFGKRTVETGTNLDRQRANTKEEDPTGLLNEGFRYRDLETGTWLSRDPAGFVDGPNLYAYVRCNPWTKWDPHGLESWADPRGLPGCSPALRSALDEQDRERAASLAKDAHAVGQWMNGHPRTMGALQAAGGVAQLAAGVVGLGAPEPTGLTKAAGYVAIAHGADDVQAGVRQALTGKQVENVTTQMTEGSVKALGGSDTTAKVAGVVVNIGAGLVAPSAGIRGAISGVAAKTPPTFSGTAKPWTKGATPNSTYTHIDPKTGKAVQNAIYDDAGDVVGHVDFKNHGPGAPSGHGHTFPQPGNPASGHGAGKPHIPNNQLPPGWDTLPPGVQPHTPLGQ